MSNNNVFLSPVASIEIFLLLALLIIHATGFSQGVNLDFSANEACAGNLTTLIASSDLSPQEVDKYLWDLNNDGFYDDAEGDTVHHIFPTANIHLVGLLVKTANNEEYRLVNPKPVTVNPLPNVAFAVENLCEGNSSVLTSYSSISSGTIAEYKWDFNDDGLVDDLSGPVVMHGFGSAGQYTARLELESDKGCSNEGTLSFNIFSNPNSLFVAADFCHEDSTLFSSLSTSGTDSIMQYVWTFGEGGQSFTAPVLRYRYSNPGVYTARLIVINNHECADTTAKDIEILPLPEFTINTGDTDIFKGNFIEISVAGSDIASVNWSTGESNLSILTGDAGEYSVTVTGSNGCPDSKSVSIAVKDVMPVSLVSEIITPNGDGVNDFMTIRDIEAYPNCKVSVFNQWGEQVYSSTNYQNDWGGTKDGSLLSSGAYYYIINCGAEKEIKGNINILRK